MRNMKLIFAASVNLAATLLVTGCHRPQSDMPVSVVDDYAVIVDTPIVKMDKSINGISISGTLRRRPGSTADIAGRVDVDFIDPDGEVINKYPITVGLNPPKIPRDPSSASSFQIYYGEVPPAGATVRVRFVDSVTAQREDVEGADYAAGAGGGHVGGGGGGKGRGGGGAGAKW